MQNDTQPVAVEVDTAAELQKSATELDHIIKDFSAGTFAGIAIIFSGHPFDTVKVRLQMKKQTLGTCLRQMYKQEGLASFYKGIETPLYSVPFINAIIFGAYGFMRRQLLVNATDEFTFSQGLVAGAFAGLVNCVILSPVELVKIRLQMDESRSGTSLYNGAFDCMRKVYRHEGIKGIYRGMVSSILREIPAYAAQFGTYEIVKAMLLDVFDRKFEIAQNLISGGIAGLACWLASYPQDVVKTRLQCDLSTGSNQKYPAIYKDGGFTNCTMEIYRQEGLRGFWRGFSACAMRAVFANAVGFYAYESAKDIFFYNDEGDE